MRGQNSTFKNNLVTPVTLGIASAVALTAIRIGPAPALESGVLEEIGVTAQKREKSLPEVPISVATTSGERPNVLFTGSEDLLALSGRMPGLYAESSNGPAAPHFYLRGLGNTGFVNEPRVWGFEIGYEFGD